MFVFAYFAVIAAAVAMAVSMLPSKVKERLGKAAALVAAVVLFTVLFGGVLYGALAEEDVVEGYYPLTAVVVDLDYNEDVLVLEDGAELVWEFESIEDFEIGDIVSLLMWDNNTPDSIYDDVILLVYYSGFSIDREEVE